KTLFATTYDVSKRGVQLLCDGITVREIFGGPGLSRPTKPPSVLLKLRLSHSAQDSEQIDAECRAVFSRRVSEQEYRVGLQIHSISESSRMALENFVDECLELS
ncbi:MAG TPA: PilZ domain-containing protein, partial [Gammaproteobacteria bacterium]|nr:PilZ domain-containing protein [Gammaproteobacteria bacterium]